jgi:uncharacterized protein YjbJ (UPF0337 family)
MNRDRIAGAWKQLRGTAKVRWGLLTGHALTVAEGAREQLAGRVQERRGRQQEETESQLEDFMRRNRNWRDAAAGNGKGTH